MSTERSALLPSDASLLRRHFRSTSALPASATASNPSANSLFNFLQPSSQNDQEQFPAPHPHAATQKSSMYARFRYAEHKARTETHRFLVSKAGHYAVLALVTADVCCIFAEFLVSLYRCEEFCCGKLGGSQEHGNKLGVVRARAGLDSMLGTMMMGSMGATGREEAWATAQGALGSVSVAFSCLFMLELLASLWGFGVREFFKSKFHTFDACVILLSFLLDVCLKGVLEEVGAIVVVLRLWRVFKIIEELGAGMEDREERWEEVWGEQITKLREENTELRERLEARRAVEEGESSRRAGNGDSWLLPEIGGFR